MVPTDRAVGHRKARRGRTTAVTPVTAGGAASPNPRSVVAQCRAVEGQVAPRSDTSAVGTSTAGNAAVVRRRAARGVAGHGAVDDRDVAARDPSAFSAVRPRRTSRQPAGPGGVAIAHTARVHERHILRRMDPAAGTTSSPLVGEAVAAIPREVPAHLRVIQGEGHRGREVQVDPAAVAAFAADAAVASLAGRIRRDARTGQSEIDADRARVLDAATVAAVSARVVSLAAPTRVVALDDAVGKRGEIAARINAASVSTVASRRGACSRSDSTIPGVVVAGRETADRDPVERHVEAAALVRDPATVAAVATALSVTAAAGEVPEHARRPDGHTSGGGVLDTPAVAGIAAETLIAA